MDNMTEQMAIEILKAKLSCKELEFSPHTECCEEKCDECVYAYAQGTVGEQKEAIAMGIAVLEEIQQYRAIGTVDELQALKEIDEDCIIRHLTGECSYNETGCSGCIGREKIRVALEKSVAKKAPFDFENEMYICPNCAKAVGGHQKYCWNCGQAFNA